jgi:hypothetical protein
MQVGCTRTDITREPSSPLRPHWMAGWLAGTLDVQQARMQGLSGHYREGFRLGGQQQEATIIALSITFPSTCRSSLNF